MVFDRKAYNRAYYLIHQKQAKEYGGKYRLEHPEQVKESQKKWRLIHREYIRQYQVTHKKQANRATKKWRLAHPEETKEGDKKYYLVHKKQVIEKKKQYGRTLKGKEVNRKHHAIRKNFGFIPLNKPSLGTEGHHIDKERVIYIPKGMHRSIWHSVLNNINMNKINRLAFNWLKTKEGIKIKKLGRVRDGVV